MSKLIFGSAAAAVVAFSLTALAPDAAKSQSVFEACSSEITSQCSTVLPGNGHLYACLYANEEKLSEACDDAVEDVLDQLDIFFELIRYAKQECAVDIAQYSSSVEMGGGRIFSCLKAQTANLTKDCSAVMGNISVHENCSVPLGRVGDGSGIASGPFQPYASIHGDGGEQLLCLVQR